MEASFKKLISGYQKFRQKYATGDGSVMNQLADLGQKPEVMIVACCDSRVDPSIILQCDPGDLFIVRNVANIVPPYAPDDSHHATSAALEYGVCYLKVKHLILLGHSQCGGIQALSNPDVLQQQNDFIGQWVSSAGIRPTEKENDLDALAKRALYHSYQNCLSFPWIAERVNHNALKIHRWFFDIKKAEIYENNGQSSDYQPLN